MATEPVNKFLHNLDVEEKLYQWAESLGCSPKQQTAFVKAFNDEKVFRWTGVRMEWVHGDGTTSIATSDPNCLKWLQQEYGFLLPTPKPVDERGIPAHLAIGPDIIEKALNGSLTAKGQIAVALSAGGKVDVETTELFLKAEAKKRGSGGTDVRQPEHKPINYTGDNPFTRLRLPSGAVNKEAEAEIAEITRTRGFAETKRLADAAGVNLSGHPLPGRKYA
jgi:hypothetical protein